MRRAVPIVLTSLILVMAVAGGALVASRWLLQEDLIGAGPVPTTSAPPTSASTTTTAAPPPTTAAAAPPTAPPPLAWTRCGQLECATLFVPLDHRQPAGRQIGIALNRRRAGDPARRIGSLLVNPGGPGASGVDLLPSILGRLSTGVKARFDIVGFDPRGTGRSAPVRCLESAQLAAYFAVDPTPDNAGEKTALVQAVERFVAGCRQRSGDILPHVGTADAARDMDRIRVAVGDEKLTFLGFSYGTSLGATYAELFPDRVRALVLDGAIDPSLDTPSLNRGQGAGFERAFAAFVADCRARGTACPWRPPGGATKEAFVALSARIDARPAAAGSRRVGPSEFFLGSAAFLYSRETWPALARGLAQAERGGGTLILAGFDSLVNRNPDGSFANDQEANAAINCLDNPAPRDVAAYEREAADAARTTPAFGPAVAWSGLVCGLWPIPPTGRAERLRAPGTPPILVIGTTNDPATPYEWAEALAAQLLAAGLLRFEGEGHPAYGENPCTTRIADAYLLDLTIPAGELRC